MGRIALANARAPRPVAEPGGRLPGVDVARALAFGGMLLAHYAASHRADDPGWLRAVEHLADGRAAPLFCVVLGVGAGILAARGASDAALLRRGAVLFALGLAVWPYVERVYLILPHYGILLALVPLLRRLPTRWLLPVAGAAFLVPSLIVALVDEHGLRGAPQPSSYGELLDIGYLVRQLAWTGGYPLVGWIGFGLVGLFLVRLPLRDPGTQRRLLVAGVAVAASQVAAAAVFAALGGRDDPNGAAGLAAFFDGSAHSNQTAWYVLASATAVAVIAGCLALTRRPSVWTTPLVRLGQLALTAYLAHILLGSHVVWEWRDTTNPSLARQLGVVALVFAAFAIVATAWRARFRHGPVEALTRVLSR